ncbi:tubulin epsilon and delta complex protein 1 isoform X3 [Girardinichthys multiradiatus]|uniref:tubulin epsilon and delta complex protein 1 isoform X3 n=1 Tax=Girardinichthys multiradiatus TaxID=208333 RepID=UPI001FAB5FB7|nr:tubulin epsilon and delta complex protein 1 isoform X3 [Girardinichthys multiradiatus]
MQRSKAGTVEVKRVIEALCRLLATLGLDPVPAPEVFRRAKFGGRSQEDPLWQLLSNILQTSGIISSETCSQLSGERRKLVAVGLWQSGYYGDWMYGTDGGSFTSRDLLLALGWLLAKGALEKMLTGRVEQLDRTLLPSAPEKWEFSGELELDAASLRRLQWLMGHLRHQRRTLLSTIGVRTRVLHDVLFTNQICTAAPSSGQSSAALTEDCVRVQQLCDLLEAYVSWKQVENIFWNWMDSVADCRLSDLYVRTSFQQASQSLGTCCPGNRGLAKLKEILMRLPNKQVTALEAQSELQEDDSDVASQSLSLSSLLSVPSIHKVCCARLQAEKTLRRPSEGPHSRAEGPGELPLSQATELLLQAETVQLQRRDGQRLANRKQLQELMGSLDELVFIPL